MKPLFVSVFLIFVAHVSHAQNRFWVATTNSNWNNTANWSATSGGTGGASVPGSGNLAIFNGNNGSNGDCILDIAPTVGGITMNGYSGTIDLSGNTLTTTGNNNFVSGTVTNTGGAATLTFNTTGSTTFNGSSFNVPIAGTSGTVLFDGSLFNASVTLIKTNTVTDTGDGGNTFNGPVTLTMSGTNVWRMGETSPDVFNDDLTLNLTTTGTFSLARVAAATQFNGNITINYLTNGAVFFGSNGGSSTLADGGALTINGDGDLTLNNFTQDGATAQSIVMTGTVTSNVVIAANTAFDGNLTTSSSSFTVSASTFHGTTQFIKTGSTDNTSTGGNTFTGDLTIDNRGTGHINFGNASPDIFDGTLALIINNTGDISMARTSAANQFNGDIAISYLNVGDVLIGDNGGTSTLEDGQVISITSGASGAGDLTLSRFTQDGTTAQNIALTGNDNAVLRLGPLTTFDGNLTVTAPSFILNTSTFNGSTTFTKTGTAVSNQRGGNAFHGLSTFNNQGADIEFGNVSTDAGDIWHGDAIFNNTGGNRIRIGSSTSGNIFHGNVTLNAGGVTDVANRIQVSRFSGGQTTFNGDVTINNTGFESDIQISYDAGSLTTFNGDVFLHSSVAGDVEFVLANNGNVVFNGDIQFNSSVNENIYLSSGTGTATFGNGSLSIGSFTIGSIRFRNFTQTGTTAQTLVLTSTAALYLGSSSTFTGNVSFTSPQVYLHGCTYHGTTYIEKTGANANSGAGTNVFNGITTLVNSGSGNLELSNPSNDHFNNDLTLTNTGTALISVGDNSAGNIIDGNLTVNSTSGNGIYFANNTGASITLTSPHTITVGGLGFTSGQLRLRRFTQQGTTAQNLTLTGTATLMVGPASTFQGAVTFIAPRYEMDGCIYERTAYIEKSGGSNDDGTGGNTFMQAATIVNSGSGYLRTAVTSPDVFQGQVTFTNSGSSYISVASASTGTTFSTNIIANSTSGAGVLFGNNTGGGATLANGATLTTGTFTAGELKLTRFTQTGGTSQTLNLTGTAMLTLGPTTRFNANVDFKAPQVVLSGCTFDGTAVLEKTGATTNTGTGGDVFNGATTITNSGSGAFELANTVAVTFNSSLIVNNTGSSRVQIGIDAPGITFHGPVTINFGGNTSSLNTIIARNAASSATFLSTLTLNCTNANANSGIIIANDGTAVIQGNVIVSSTAGRGILFGASTGSVSLADGYTVTTPGAGTFTTGTLTFNKFTQTGGTAQNLALTGSATILTGPGTTFNGNCTFSAPNIELDGATFNGVTTITKTGTGNNDNNGGNIFNGTTTLTNNGTGRWRLGENSGDTFNADVSFVRNSGTMEIAYNNNNTFTRNISLTSSTALAFGAGTGSMLFTGTNSQSISKTGGSLSPTIRSFTINKASGSLTLSTDVTVTSSATFTSGNVNTTSTNLLTFADNATVSGANDLSYVDGPVRKTGNDAFTFPTGAENFYRPIGISAPAVTTDRFTAQYFLDPQAFGSVPTWDPSFYTVSGCEYWTLDRTNGTSNVNVTLSWKEAACGAGYITTLPELRVARWNGTTWVSHGNGGTTGNATNGTIVTSAAVTSFSPFTLATTSGQNPLPVELTRFWASDVGATVTLNWTTSTEINSDFFTLQRSENGTHFENIRKIPAEGNSTLPREYTFIDESPLPGRSYYRLQQTDFDGETTTFNAISVQRSGSNILTLYPNPGGNEIIHFSEKTTATIFNNLNQIIGIVENTDHFDATAFPSGIYMVRTDRGKFSRFVKE